VIARDAYLRGETVIIKEAARGKYITYHKARKKYRVTVTKDKKRHCVGYFPTQEEAVVGRDASLRGETVIKPAVRESPYGKYITYHKASSNYQVRVYYKDKKKQHVGYFPTQEEAVAARDASLRGETVIKPAVRESPYGKYITYHKASNKYVVQVTKDKKKQVVGRFATQEEAVVARDGYLRSETDDISSTSGVKRKRK
jgi:hypothetical protein